MRCSSLSLLRASSHAVYRALLFGKKLSAQELHQNGFFNGLFPPQPDASFRKTLLASIEQQLAGLELDVVRLVLLSISSGR